MLGLPTSMALEIVRIDARGLNWPVARYAGTTSFAFVAATNRSMGAPARFANSPAVRLPKLPLGVQTIGDSVAPGLTAQLGDGLEVIDHLRQQPADVDGVRGGQRNLSAQARVGERLFDQSLAIVEAAGHRVARERSIALSSLNIVSWASCVGLTRPSGYRITTRALAMP